MSDAAATYVLVHGAWHGPWAWETMTPLLDERGIPWIAPSLPSAHDDVAGTADLAADAAAVVHAARDRGPVVLVGHSYGGVVITEAAASLEVTELAYIAALVPRIGESATDCSRRVRTRTLLDEAMRVEGPWLALDPDAAVAALYGHLDAGTAAREVIRLGRQTLVSFRSPRHAPDIGAPRRYLRCTDDRAIDPQLQVLMSQECGDVVDLASDHSPFRSHVEACVAFVLGEGASD